MGPRGHHQPAFAHFLSTFFSFFRRLPTRRKRGWIQESGGRDDRTRTGVYQQTVAPTHDLHDRRPVHFNFAPFRYPRGGRY